MKNKVTLYAPTQEEQLKISALLDKIDEVIMLQEQILILHRKHKQGLLQNLFPQKDEKVPKMRFKEFMQDGDWINDLWKRTFG